ncbi:hypothetical protein MIND_01027100 [Mycena indigotica]|uniref:Uncharacterized protein n=1 Tax=Mycena indigotica TaxID=2126181 RepID=A0A8H6S9L7_9AGAR|nr:uncharacterized protein MIND_01027100 [Mycena indigotica]KAF7294892.1 hypothetical protein MIND_01027100 [Mycena indigotica]
MMLEDLLKEFPALPEEDTEPLLPPPLPHSEAGYFYGYKIMDDFDRKNTTHLERVYQIDCAPSMKNLAQLIMERNTILVLVAVYSTEAKAVVGCESGTERIPNKILREKLEKEFGVTEGPQWHLDDGTFFWASGAAERFRYCWRRPVMPMPK